MSSNKAKLLPTSLQNSLLQVVKLSNQSQAQIRAICLSTTEGVPLGRVYGASHYPERLQEETLVLLETVWAPPSKQLSAVGMGDKVYQITAIYDHGILIHLYLAPLLVVTILCQAEANLGAIRTTAIPLLQQVLEPLRTTLVESLKPQDDDVDDDQPPPPPPHHPHGGVIDDGTQGSVGAMARNAYYQ